MKQEFDSLPWHDAVLLGINIDRSNPGNLDAIILEVRWPDETKSKIIFNDCYYFEAKMNFGIVSEESILKSECFIESPIVNDIKKKWRHSGASFEHLNCYQVLTNSTNSSLTICALSFVLR